MAAPTGARGQVRGFDGAGVDERDGWEGVAGGVLHGEAVGVGEHGIEGGGQLSPTGVDGAGAGERVEARLLNAMDQLRGSPWAGMR